jgi:hypothetical protein
VLELKIVIHEKVAPGSFPIEVRLDLTDEFFIKSGWRNTIHAQQHMTDWCRERWGKTTGETYTLEEARWMFVGKRFYVRTEAQAIELKMRWHGATP